MKGELADMGSLAEGIAKRAAAEAAEKAAKKARKEGAESNMVSSIRNLMETAGWTLQQAMDALKIPVADQKRYAAMV